LKPEAAQYLRRAEATLRKAEAILAIGITDIAAREAYLAAFHAAEAFIFEVTGKVAKTHRGVRSEFARLTRQQATLVQCVDFLSRGYEWKTDADYGTGGDIEPAPSQAAAAIEDARAIAAELGHPDA